MIKGLEVRELPSRASSKGLLIDLRAGGMPDHLLTSCHSIFPESVEAWKVYDQAYEKVICLQGMIKLVTCDRRQGSPSSDEIAEMFLGEYRLREVRIPPGVLRGWKAIGSVSALVLSVLEGDDPAVRVLSPEEAAVPYDWEIVMR